MVNQETIDLIKKYEGCRLISYQDSVGVWTIGYGHTAGVKEGMVITEPMATQMLATDLAYFEAQVLNLVKVALNEYQLGALVSFTYNVGVGNLKKSTLLKLLNKGDFTGAANEFQKWTKAGNKVLSGLVKRRLSEKDLFTRGSNMIAEYSLKNDGNYYVSKNFQVKEFACKDGSDKILVDVDFVRTVLQDIRDHFASPVIINSAYRTPEYNKKIGGATNSYHLKGRAFDIAIKGRTPKEIAQYALAINTKGIIQYNSFVHVDSRDTTYHAINNNGKVTTTTTF